MWTPALRRFGEKKNLKKVIILLFITILFISCNNKKNTETESWNQFNKTIEEIKNKKSGKKEIDYYSCKHILNNYEFDFGFELCYRISNGKIEKLNNKFEWEIDENSSYEINENGFLLLDKTIFIDHNLDSVIDFEYPHASYKLNDKRLKSISSDGYFSESINGKLVEYKIENLKTSVMNGFELGDNPMYTNPVPFVTKRGNSGIGEKIYIKCVNPQDSISILPGYVNTIRQDLFYKNNRPKEIKIIDDDSNYVMSATLADIAIFQKIPLKKKIKNFTIEIVDVYKGTKYDDTCISGILIE